MRQQPATGTTRAAFAPGLEEEVMCRLELEQFNAKMLQFCGRYAAVRGDLTKEPGGEFLVHNWHSIDVAEVNSDADRIERTAEDILRDKAEHVLLFKQHSGTTTVVHNGRTSILNPRAFVLLDSTLPTTLIFGGNRSHFFLVQVPHSVFVNWRKADVEFGRVCAAPCCKGMALEAAFPGTHEPSWESPDDAAFLFDLARIAFLKEDKEPNIYLESRYKVILQLLDQHLTNPELSVELLAAIAKMSTRQLQRDFHAHGTTFSRMLVERRIALVVQKLQRNLMSGASCNIASTAFDCGFREISNFNRVFKKKHGCCPSDYIAMAAERAQRKTTNVDEIV